MENHRQFKPYDRVLVMDCQGIWQIDYYSHWSESYKQHITLAYGDGMRIDDPHILPYEGNEELLGTTREPEQELTLKEGECILVSDDPADFPFYCFIRLFDRIEAGNWFRGTRTVKMESNKWRYALRLSDINPANPEGCRKHILCVKGGKITRYNKAES